MNRQFTARNVHRCVAKDGFDHPIESWSLSDWFTAFAGEVGEAGNIIKKLNRFRDNIPGNSETPEELKAKLAEELADAYTYLDLLAFRADIDLEKAVLDKFEKVSRRMGYREGGESN